MGKHGTRMPIAGLTSASEPNHTHTGNQMPLDGLIPDSKHTTNTRIQNANRWAYVELHTKMGKHGTRMPIAGLTSASEPTNTH